MADRSRILKLNILAETKDLVKGLDKANQEVSGAGEKIGAAFKKVAVVAAAAAAAVGAFAIKLGKDSIQAAIQAESQQNRLRQILLATGAATEEQIKGLDRQANALERVGVVSAGNIKVAQSQLATFDLQATTIKTLTPAILDYVTAEKGATASSEDFKSMTNGLAQALQGNFASLTRTGFVLDENTKNLIKNGTETERAAALVEVLNSTYKGFNETLAQTTEGRLQQLRNNFDRIKETIGAVLLPVFNQMVKFIAEKIIPIIDNLVARFEKDASPAMNRIKEIIVGFVLPALKNLWAFIKEYVVPILNNLLKPAIDILIIGFQFLRDKFKENEDKIRDMLGVFQNVWAFIRDYLSPILGGALATAFNILFRAIAAVVETVLGFFSIIQKVARFLGYDLSLNLDFATKATNNLNTGTVEAYKSFQAQSKGIKESVVPALDSVVTSQNAVASSTAKATKEIKEQTKASEALVKIKKELAKDPDGGKAVEAARDARTAAARLAAQALTPNLENLTFAELLAREFATGDPISFYNSLIGGGVSGLTPSQAIAAGLGGATPLQLENLARYQNASAGGITPITINVNGTVLDPEGVARAIQDVLQQSNARSGTQSLTPVFGVE